MKRKLIILSMSIISFIIVSSLTIMFGKALFNNINYNGASFVKLRTIENVNPEKIKYIISNNTNIDTKDIQIQQEKDILSIKLKYLPQDITDAISNEIINEFGNSIEIINTSSVEKSTRPGIVYLIYFVILLYLLINIALIVKIFLSILRSRKAENSYIS